MSDRRFRAGEPFPSRDKAEAEVRDGRLRFPVAYDLSPGDMHRLGLYISPPQPGEISRPFAEPALFVVRRVVF